MKFSEIFLFLLAIGLNIVSTVVLINIYIHATGRYGCVMVCNNLYGEAILDWFVVLLALIFGIISFGYLLYSLFKNEVM